MYNRRINTSVYRHIYYTYYTLTFCTGILFEPMETDLIIVIANIPFDLIDETTVDS
jgi:hypothetical protein